MKRTKFFLFLLLVLTGCQWSNRNQATDSIPQIDLSRSYSKKEIHLRDIADVEYIPLETTGDVLLANNRRPVHISDRYILVTNRRQGDIFVFKRNGKIDSHFNHRGRGGMEYTSSQSIVFDEKNREIFVVDRFSTSRIMVYSMTGEYKRTLKYPGKLSLTAYGFDDQTLFVYDDYGLSQNKYNPRPYMFLSKEDGSMISALNLTLPVRYSEKIWMETTDDAGNPITTSLNISIPYHRYYGEDFVVADISSDTIFRLAKNKDLIPLAVRTPSVHAAEPRTVWTSKLTTDKFMVLEKKTLDFKKKIPSTTLMYEFETGQINEITFINDDFPSREWEMSPDVAVPENTAALLMDASILVEAYENHELKGELGELAVTLGEEDNPVLMIVKFK